MDEVRRLRLEKGWNQNELAFHADLAPSVISQVETGKREPSAATLRKLATALGVEIPDLFREPALPKAERAVEEPERRREPSLLEEPAGPSTGREASQEPGELLVKSWREDLRRWDEKIPAGERPSLFDYGKLVGWAHAVVEVINYYELSARQDPGLTQRRETVDMLGRMEDVKQATLRLLERVFESVKTDAAFREIWEANDLGSIPSKAESP